MEGIGHNGLHCHGALGERALPYACATGSTGPDDPPSVRWNADNRFGRSYLTGAVSIAVIVHSDCLIAGHGPGAATIMQGYLVKGEARIGMKVKARYLRNSKFKPTDVYFVPA